MDDINFAILTLDLYILKVIERFLSPKLFTLFKNKASLCEDILNGSIEFFAWFSISKNSWSQIQTSKSNRMLPCKLHLTVTTSRALELIAKLNSVVHYIYSKIVSVWSLSFFDDDEEQWGHSLEFQSSPHNKHVVVCAFAMQYTVYYILEY